MELNRKTVLIGVAGLAIVAGGGWVASRTLWSARQPTEKRLKVTARRVVNGHYVKVDNDDKLVYAGIRAPYENEPYHEEAKRRNAELVVGKELRLRFDEDVTRDDDERLLAYAFVDDFFVNEALVLEGLAYVRLTPQTQRYADLLLAAQRDARQARRGLWSQVGPGNEKSYPADPKYGDFHRPACEIVPRIKPERRVELPSKQAAFDQGFAPCNKCNP